MAVRRAAALVPAAALALTAAAAAAPVAVTNPGFEDTTGGQTYNEFTFLPPAGWQLDDPGLIAGNGGITGPFFVGTLNPALSDPAATPGSYP